LDFFLLHFFLVFQIRFWLLGIFYISFLYICFNRLTL
jgi:hypothetical protein